MGKWEKGRRRTIKAPKVGDRVRMSIDIETAQDDRETLTTIEYDGDITEVKRNGDYIITVTQGVTETQEYKIRADGWCVLNTYGTPKKRKALVIRI